MGDDYEVPVNKSWGTDQITLKVEMLSGAEGRQEDTEAQRRNQLRFKTNLRFDLEFHDFGSLPRYDVKAGRFKHLRKKE